MLAIICIPWRPGDADRERAYRIVTDYYAGLDIPIRTGDSDDMPFSPGRSRNFAANAAKDWDVALFVDADCLIPRGQIGRGFGHALTSGRVTIPWDAFYSMTKEGHLRGLDATNPIGEPLHEHEWKANSVGCANPCYSPTGCFICPREVWDQVGGYDPRFSGWSHEDAAFLLKAGVIDRLSGPMYHFWHRSHAYSTPIPEFYYREYATLPLEQVLIDEGRRIERFGGWG